MRTGAASSGRAKDALHAAFRCRSRLPSRRPRGLRRRELRRGLRRSSGRLPAATAPANPRCCGPSRGWCESPRASSTLEGGDPELTIAEQAHYLGHQDALKPSLSVGENCASGPAFSAPSAARIDAPLEAVGLDALADLPAAYLSAGQRRRLSIARLLAVKRPIWLLDEPMSTLDAAAQERLTGFMRAHLPRAASSSPRPTGRSGMGAPRSCGSRKLFRARDGGGSGE